VRRQSDLAARIKPLPAALLQLCKDYTTARIKPKADMQLRSGIKMMPQRLDRSQGLRGAAEPAESMSL
jgi:hypothetical protein